jgi:cytochrome c553
MEKEVKQVIQSFGKELKGELMAAMKAGGPTNAIPVCADKAPSIASRLSRETGWMVRRVSLKARNPLDTPDAWEVKTLQDFDAKVAAGTAPQGLAHSAIETTDNGRYYRFAMAIPTMGACLNCHGTDDKQHPAAKTALQKMYPHDVATGYQVGMVRGAFSVKVPLD